MQDKLTLTELQKFLESRSLPDFFKDWITESQLRQLIGISANTLKNKRSLNQITYSKICNTFFMYYVPDLETELSRNMVKKK